MWCVLCVVKLGGGGGRYERKGEGEDTCLFLDSRMGKVYLVCAFSVIPRALASASILARSANLAAALDPPS